jgi:hypothetical protein
VAAGEAPRFVRGDVDGGRLRRIYSSYPDAASALAAAGLSEADEWLGSDSTSRSD